MKQEFLSYLRDHDEPEETDINTVCNLIEAVQLINCYKKIIEAQYKRVIRYNCEQEEILKQLKVTEKFFDNAGQSRFSTSLKIRFYKILKQYLAEKINKF